MRRLNHRPEEEGIKTGGHSGLAGACGLNHRPEEEGIKTITVFVYLYDVWRLFESQT